MRIRPLAFVLALALASALGCAERGHEIQVAVPAEPAASTPAEAVVDITEAARTHLDESARQNRLRAGWMVRLSVRPGGCTGMTNHLDLDTGPLGRGDATSCAGGITCVYARDQYPFIQGARIDYVTENGMSGFKVTYPHQTPENRARTAEWIKAAFPDSGLILDPAPAAPPTQDTVRPAEQP